MFISTGEQLEEEHRARPSDWQIADLVDDHQAREHERAESVRKPAARLRFFQRVQEIRQRGEVDAASMLRRRDRQTEREDASMSVKR